MFNAPSALLVASRLSHRPPGICGSVPLPRHGAGPGVARSPRTCCGPGRSCASDAGGERVRRSAMHERDRARGPEEIDRREPVVQPLRPEAAEGVLALQRGAGNQAVSALLARSPDGGKPQAPDKKPEAPAAAGARATLPGIGTIAIQSAPALPVGRAGRVDGGAGSGSGRVHVQDVTCMSKIGEHSAKLMRATLDGKPMDVEIVLPRGKGLLRIKLAGAIVSSYNTSAGGPDATESWTLNFQSIEQTFEGEREE